MNVCDLFTTVHWHLSLEGKYDMNTLLYYSPTNHMFFCKQHIDREYIMIATSSVKHSLK